MGLLLRVRLEVEEEARRTSVHRRVIAARLERKREETVETCYLPCRDYCSICLALVNAHR